MTTSDPSAALPSVAARLRRARHAARAAARSLATRSRALRPRLDRSWFGGRDDFPARIVWIFGSPRSGSTWLWKTLADHPSVVAINEPQVGYYLGPFMSDQPGVDPFELDVDSFTLRRQQRDAPHHLFAEAYRDAWAPALARLLEDRFRAQAIRHPASVPFEETVVVVKEPNGSQSADIVMSVQPRARLLFLLRDGRDVVDSELAAVQAGSWLSKEFAGFTGISPTERRAFVVQSAHKWLWRTQVVEEAFAAHHGPKLLLRYEELLADPELHLQRVLDWLGLPVTAGQLRELVDQNRFERMAASGRGPTSFYRAASPGLWKENLDEEEQAVVHDILGDKLSSLGYPVPDRWARQRPLTDDR